MQQKEKIERMQALIATLNEAAKAYYQESRERMPNHEYDALYDELTALEAETGMTLSQSPTQKVGYEVLSQLPKERHPQKMLSLDKTKDVNALVKWLGARDGVLSWKLDGLTIVRSSRRSRAATEKSARSLPETPESLPICRLKFLIAAGWCCAERP